ncbi:hypothetical protein BX81_09700 [Escherichia coli O165:H25 str. 2010C-4874]|nr:hypothetical protein BX81_09700 [Escherichia coli O165:H25 str. 2010C-4874]
MILLNLCHPVVHLLLVCIRHHLPRNFPQEGHLLFRYINTIQRFHRRIRGFGNEAPCPSGDIVNPEFQRFRCDIHRAGTVLAAT